MSSASTERELGAQSGNEENDEEKSRLLSELGEVESTRPLRPTSLSPPFWITAVVNSSATAGIVGVSRKVLGHRRLTLLDSQIFVNKRIFEDESLRHAQVTFAAFHFTVTALLLWIISRPSIDIFEAKRINAVQLLPLAVTMMLNVILPNASLANSSIQFYQVMRVLLTPCVALLNYLDSRATIPRAAALTLVPICVGVAVVSYCDTQPRHDQDQRATSPLGAAFALSGVFASALYTVFIRRYHQKLECTSMQLLLNQAPLSVLMTLSVIPFSDDLTIWGNVSSSAWMLILTASPGNEVCRLDARC